MMSTIEVWHADGLSVAADWRFEAQTRSVRPSLEPAMRLLVQIEATSSCTDTWLSTS